MVRITSAAPPMTAAVVAAVAPRHRRPVPTRNPDMWNVSSDSNASSSRRTKTTEENDGDPGIADISSKRRRSTLIRLPIFFSSYVSCFEGSRRSKKQQQQRRQRNRIVLSSAVLMGAVLYFLIHMVGLGLFLGSGAVPPLLTHTLDFENDCRFFANHQHLPILIVGGTDGSGTRAVVETLGSLGVTVVADDDQTMDLHASALFRKQGWPALVTTFLGATGGSLTDEFDTLPTTTQQILLREMKSLQQYVARKYANENRRNRQRPDLYRHFRKSTSEHDPTRSMAHASKVAFVIKAPATLLVLPILWKFFQPIRFIHVVRDGRDIALSDNQSPVLKFYNVTYPQDYEERSNQYTGELYPVRAMQLWNDWNVQIQHWATTTTTTTTPTKKAPAVVSGKNRTTDVDESSATVPSFGYMVLRTEDLVVDSCSTKFHALTRLADFVGSSLTPHQLCCLAKAPPRDYGQSNIHSETINNHMIPAGNRAKGKGAAGSKNSRTGSDDANRLVMEIQEKEAELERLHAQLNQIRDPDLRDQRRLLLEIPKLVPSLFLKQLAAWQDRVHLSAGEYRTETIQKLLRYGHSLFTQYEHNRQALESEISPKEIQDTIDYLRKLLENRGVSQEDPPKSKQQMMHQSINSRYGKWKEKLANRTQLSLLLHQEGKDALQLFGYEPRKEWDYRLRIGRIPSDADLFSCDRSISCGRTRLHAQEVM